MKADQMSAERENVETVEGLNRAFPNGWRSGDAATDAMTFMLARSLRRCLSAMFPGSDR